MFLNSNDSRAQRYYAIGYGGLGKGSRPRLTHNAFGRVLIGFRVSGLSTERLVADDVPPHRRQLLVGTRGHFHLVVASCRFVLGRFARIAATVFVNSGRTRKNTRTHPDEKRKKKVTFLVLIYILTLKGV